MSIRNLIPQQWRIINLFGIFDGVGIEMLLSAGGSGVLVQPMWIQGLSIELARDAAMDLHTNDNQRVIALSFGRYISNDVQNLENEQITLPREAAGVKIASGAAEAPAIEAAKLGTCFQLRFDYLNHHIEWDQPAVSVHVKYIIAFRCYYCVQLQDYEKYAFCLLHVSCSSGLLYMFKYVISTKMEVLNLSLRGPNYSALPFAKMDIGE
ncbi:hypothetical protein C5167_015975 [Papaver somniferum]|nr:hypothetical protein C5167_015975 [Papaver somniferum]